MAQQQGKPSFQIFEITANAKVDPNYEQFLKELGRTVGSSEIISFALISEPGLSISKYQVITRKWN